MDGQVFIPRMPLDEVLDGCVWERPGPWPGRARLLDVPDEERLGMLVAQPGVLEYAGSKAIESGIYLPVSLLEAGRWPTLLEQIPPDPCEATKSGTPLRLYQRRAVSFLRRLQGDREGGILALDMGLGKTACALQALWLEGLLDQPGIVCGPLASAAAWTDDRSDAAKWYGMDVRRLGGKKNPDPAQLAGVRHVFLNYDIVSGWWTYLIHMLKPAWIIYDEIHMLMHGRAQRSEAAVNLSLGPSVVARWGLTGTPIPNRRMDLWHQLRVVQPRQWGKSFYHFGTIFAGGRLEVSPGAGGEGHMVYEEDTNTEHLISRLSGSYLRCTKSQVSDDLPAITRQVRKLKPDPDNEKMQEYWQAARYMADYIRQKNAAKVGEDPEAPKGIKTKGRIEAIEIQAIGVLIGLLSDMKADQALRHILDLLDEHDHIVVFTWRRPAAARVAKALNRYFDVADAPVAGKRPKIFGPVDGTVQEKDRRRLAREFSTERSAVYVATLGAAGISINELVQASAVVFTDLHWNPATLLQAESRVHRSGSPHKKVHSTYLIVRDTVDERLLRLLQGKADAAEAVSSGDKEGTDLASTLLFARSASTKDELSRICTLLSEAEGSLDE